MPETGRPAPATWTARRVRASGSSILLAVLALVAVFLARDLFVAAVQPLGWVAAAMALALVISPLVEVQTRLIPRFLAVIVTLLAVTAVLGTVGVGLFVQVGDQLAQLGDDLPAAAAELERDTGPDGVLAELRFSSLVEDLVELTSDRVSPEPTVEDAAGTVPAYFVTGVLVVFILLWSGRLFDAFQRQISDDERRDRLARTARMATGLARRYAVSAVTLAAVSGALAGSAAWAAGLPTPLVLGVVVGVAALVPYVGVLFGGIPIIILAAALEPAHVTWLLAGAIVTLQAFSTVVTRTVIEPASLRVGPAIIVVGVLVGSDLYGIGGALVASVAGVVAMAAVEARQRERAEVSGRSPESAQVTDAR
jgi:putative heme transporter